MAKLKLKIKLLRQLKFKTCPFCGCNVKINKHYWADRLIGYYIVHDGIVKEVVGKECILSRSNIFTNRNKLIDRWDNAFE